MGCDIHLRLEYKRKNDNKAKWESYQNGRNWSDRIYAMFAVLADVRNHCEKEHIELRGFPMDAAFCTKSKYYLRVLPDDQYDRDYEWACSESNANNWGGERITMNGHEYIVHPDWHSPNWCTTQEMRNAIDSVFKREGRYIGDNIEWYGLLGTMEGLESTGEYECRAVFWFDN